MGIEPIRTWTPSINNEFTDRVQTNQYRECCLAFHDLVVAAGWSIPQSFNGTAIQTSGTSNWLTTADVVFGTEGNGSWFIADSPAGWLDNSQTLSILFYVNENLSGMDAQEGVIRCAPKGYNTDGSASAGATGTINTIAASLHAVGVDTDTVVLNDGINPAVTYVFDDDSSVAETATNRAVRHNGTETADQMRDLLIAAINATPNLAIVATSGGAGQVDVANLANGTVGNQTITETVANGGFTVSGLSGGSAGTRPTVNGVESSTIFAGDDMIPWSAPAAGVYATWRTSRGDWAFGVKKKGEAFFSHFLYMFSNTDADGGGSGDYRWGLFASSVFNGNAVASTRWTASGNWRGCNPPGSLITTQMLAHSSAWSGTLSWTGGINSNGDSHDIPIAMWNDIAALSSPRYLGQLIDVYANPQGMPFGYVDDTERAQVQRRVALGDGVMFYVNTADLPFI